MAIDFKPKEPKVILKRVDRVGKKKIPIYSIVHNQNKYYFKEGVCHKRESLVSPVTPDKNQNQPVEVVNEIHEQT